MAELNPSGAQRVKNPDDVKIKRDLVLAKYQGFKEAAKMRRERLEGAKKFHQFKRDADELEAWISEKLQLVSEDSIKDRANLQVLLLWYGKGSMIIDGWGCNQKSTTT